MKVRLPINPFRPLLQTYTLDDKVEQFTKEWKMKLEYNRVIWKISKTIRELSAHCPKSVAQHLK